MALDDIRASCLGGNSALQEIVFGGFRHVHFVREHTYIKPWGFQKKTREESVERFRVYEKLEIVFEYKDVFIAAFFGQFDNGQMTKTAPENSLFGSRDCAKSLGFDSVFREKCLDMFPAVYALVEIDIEYVVDMIHVRI
jgi:hypothetical protein